MTLRSDISQLGEAIVEGLQNNSGASPILYQYLPNEGVEVMRDIGDLRRWLSEEPRSISTFRISVDQIVDNALRESGYYEELVALRQRAVDYPESEEEYFGAVQAILSGSGAIVRLIGSEILNHKDHSAIFVSNLSSLYPVVRISGLVESMPQISQRQVVILYPGSLSGDYGLSFMDRMEPSYFYRVKIVGRTAP